MLSVTNFKAMSLRI